MSTFFFFKRVVTNLATSWTNFSESLSVCVIAATARDQRGRSNYRSWPSEGHVTAMEDSPLDIEPQDVLFDALKTLKLDFIFI